MIIKDHNPVEPYHSEQRVKMVSLRNDDKMWLAHRDGYVFHQNTKKGILSKLEGRSNVMQNSGIYSQKYNQFPRALVWLLNWPVTVNDLMIIFYKTDVGTPINPRPP